MDDNIIYNLFMPWLLRDLYCLCDFVTNEYSDDLFIRACLSPVDISGLTSFPDYWIGH